MTATVFHSDRSFFVAFNDCGKHGLEAIVDPTQDRTELVDLIRRGDFGKDDVIAVHEYNPCEGWSRDITTDIFAEVEASARRLKDREDFPLSRGRAA